MAQVQVRRIVSRGGAGGLQDILMSGLEEGARAVWVTLGLLPLWIHTSATAANSSHGFRIARGLSVKCVAELSCFYFIVIFLPGAGSSCSSLSISDSQKQCPHPQINKQRAKQKTQSFF